MERFRSDILILLATAAVCLTSIQPVLGCAVCFGDPNSDMSKSAAAGVMFMVAVIVSLLLGIASLAAYWTIRARRLSAEADVDSSWG